MFNKALNRISYQILLSYSIPLFCLSVLSASAYSSARNTFLVETKRERINEAKEAVENASFYIADSTRSVKGKALTPTVSRYEAAYRESYQTFLYNMEVLQTLSVQDPELSALGDVLAAEGERINTISQRVFLLVDDENIDRAVAHISDLESSQINAARAALMDYLNQQLARNTENFVSAQQRFKHTIVGGTIAAAVVTLGVGWLLTNRIRRQMQRMVEVVEQNGIQVTTSSTQIAASSRQLEASVSEQVASTHQIAATTAEIAATAEELNHTIERVADLSQSASQTATQGKQNLEGMASMIQQLTAATSTISSKLGQIDDKANNINAVVTTIAKVADQTNLLSLNAAIEAEKAGEYGAGFSVVAREIRRLADQTAIATLDIENMVKDMIASVSAGVMEMDKFAQNVQESADSITALGSQMAQVIYQVQSLAPQFETVSSGMSAQAEGAQQIRSAMEQLNDTSQQTVDSVKDTNQVIVQLGDIARDLQTEVAHFRLSV